jgi:hypothetical protein
MYFFMGPFFGCFAFGRITAGLNEQFAKPNYWPRRLIFLKEQLIY